MKSFDIIINLVKISVLEPVDHDDIKK